MLPTTILIDESPRCVVRPTDMKDLQRFLRNGRGYLLGPAAEGVITHRPAVPTELEKWSSALALHCAWGGEEENFFGTPL